METSGADVTFNSKLSHIVDLAGLAIVTGGCNGIGAATARHLLQDAPKAFCALVDLQEGEAPRMIREFGENRVCHIPCDVSNYKSVQEACGQAVAWRAPVTVLVNSAGNQIKAPSFDFTPEQWASVLGVHLDGTFFWSQAVGRHMRQNGGGSIVNLASVAMYFALPQRIAYSCAKAAIGALTRTLAVEWAEYNIRVNAVAPGWVNTPLAAQAIKRDNYDASHALRENALKRFGEPDEVAQLIVFLLSNKASYITGEVINIDGGYCALKGN